MSKSAIQFLRIILIVLAIPFFISLLFMYSHIVCVDPQTIHWELICPQSPPLTSFFAKHTDAFVTILIVYGLLVLVAFQNQIISTVSALSLKSRIYLAIATIFAIWASIYGH